MTNPTPPQAAPRPHVHAQQVHIPPHLIQNAVREVLREQNSGRISDLDALCGVQKRLLENYREFEALCANMTPEMRKKYKVEQTMLQMHLNHMEVVNQFQERLQKLQT